MNINPTIWQTLPYSLSTIDKIEGRNNKRTEDFVLKATMFLKNKFQK
ncbi:hypothetical protein [Winogradskyella sp. MIT101101]